MVTAKAAGKEQWLDDAKLSTARWREQVEQQMEEHIIWKADGRTQEYDKEKGHNKENK